MIIRHIGTIARSLDSIANGEFRHIDLARGQYLYLVRIGEEPGIIQEMLSERLNVDRSTVARSVQKLEKNGLISRVLSEENQKNKRLYLTSKGKELYDFVKREHSYSEARCLEGLTPEEVRLLDSLLIKVKRNILEDWSQVKQGHKRNY